MNPPNPPRIVIEVRNGQVVGVYSNHKDTKVEIITRNQLGNLSDAAFVSLGEAIKVLYKVL